jgi:hypothetical protein
MLHMWSSMDKPSEKKVHPGHFQGTSFPPSEDFVVSMRWAKRKMFFWLVQ